jgi:hypothetical protein
MSEKPGASRRRWTTVDVVSASRELYGESAAFSRDDVKNFTRFTEAGEVGSLGDGPRGARLFSEDEVVTIVSLLPWAAALGGVEGRLAWVARCRQLLRRAPDPDVPLVIEILPARFGVARDPTLAPDRRLADVFPSSIHVDLGRVRQAVRVALRGRR